MPNVEPSPPLPSPLPLSGPLAAAASVLAPVVTGVAAAGAWVRRARIFHPRGDAFDAELSVAGAAPGSTGWGVPLLDEPRSYAAVVRTSRGAGLPHPLPDILGLAVRVLDADGADSPQDLLVNTSGSDPVLRRVFLPTWEGRPRWYSSVLPYAAGGGRVLLGATTTDGRRFALLVAPGSTGRWEQWGELRLGGKLPDAVSRDLAFDPVTCTGGGLVPVGLWQALRKPAYAGSQAARHSDAVPASGSQAVVQLASRRARSSSSPRRNA